MVYLSLYLFIACLAIFHDKVKDIKYLDLLLFLTIIIISSIRWAVGGDWRPYTQYFVFLNETQYGNILRDSLYYAINFLLKYLNFDLLGKNLVLSIFFLIPFYYVFKKKYENIYLALCIFFPIIFLVYGLGSVRQGLAIAYFFLFLYYDGNKYIKFFLAFVPLLFHTSSVIIVLLYYFSQIFFKTSKKEKLIYLSMILIGAIFFFVYSEIFLKYIKYYVYQDSYKSIGASIRALFVSVFCLIFLFIHDRENNSPLFNFVKISSIFVLFLFPLSFFLTTPIDRIMGYFLLLKLIISQELLKIYAEKYKQLITISLVIVSFSYMVIWLYFGKNSYLWLGFETFFF